MATRTPTSDSTLKPFAGSVAPTLHQLREHREQIEMVACRNKAHNVRVIGSVARGEADEKSDIDLLVDFDIGASLFDHFRLMDELTELLGVKVEVASSTGLKPRARASILGDAVPL